MLQYPNLQFLVMIITRTPNLLMEFFMLLQAQKTQPMVYDEFYETVFFRSKTLKSVLFPKLRSFI